MDDWFGDYRDADDRNDRYGLLRRETARLRGGAEEGDFFDPEEVAKTVREHDDGREGDLLVFAANDFGLPVAFRPESTDWDDQDAVRRAILDGKYATDDELDGIRRAILDAHPRVHKAVVAERDGEEVRYHLPEGSTGEANFLTVREMVGLVDYTTNSAQRDDLTGTF